MPYVSEWLPLRPTDRVYELHVEEAWGPVEWMEKTDVPIYMQQLHERFPTAVRFPIEDVSEHRAYFTNTIAYMIAHAILEGDVTEIILLGVDMKRIERLSRDEQNRAWEKLREQAEAEGANDASAD